MDAPTPRSPWWLALACIPFACAIAFGAMGARPRPIEAGPTRPALAFDEYVVDLREVAPAARVAGQFRFTNRGDEPVHIEKIVPSCGCLNPQLAKRDYAPGESGEFYVQIRTANEAPGPHEYNCKVVYRDPEPRVANVWFKAILPERQVIVRPRALMFYQFNPNPTRREIIVTDFRARKLNVIGATTTLEHATVKPLEPTRDEDGNLLAPVEVIVAGDVPPGSHDGVVKIFTDDKTYPRLIVPVRIFGPKARPERVGSAVEKDSSPQRR